MKTLISCGISILLVLVAIISQSQDIIVKKDGTEIQSTVFEVGPAEVKYYNFGTTSPIYSLMKSEIFMIKYKNGSKDVFNENTRSYSNTPFTPHLIEKTRKASLASYLLSIPIVGLGIGAAFSEAETSIPMGSAATLIFGVGIPLVTRPGKMLRDATGISGNTGMRMAGWITYGLAMGDALVLIGLAVAGADVPPSVTLSVVTLGSLSCLFMGLDNASLAVEADQTQARRPKIEPFLGANRDITGKTYQTVGIRLRL